MFTTFDQYLLRRFLQVFVILFLSTFGLFVVIDGFTNIDAFTEGRTETLDILTAMGRFYLLNSSLFFDLIASILAVIATMVVFALLQKHGEITPIMAAGVPTLRLFVPIVIGTVLVTALVVANKELLLPRIYFHLQAPRGASDEGDKNVEPVYDHRTHILISGQELFIGDRRMVGGKFVLPAREIAEDLTTLRAKEAVYVEATPEHPAGWHLKDASPAYAELSLTAKGRRIVLPMSKPEDVFVATDISFDHLYDRNQNYKYVSTPELLRRIRNPAYDLNSIRGQIQHLHIRLAQPLLNLAAVLLAIPLIVRRESRSLIANLAICSGIQGAAMGVLQASHLMGQANLISPDLAAWAPVIATGTFAAWLTGVIQT